MHLNSKKTRGIKLIKENQNISVLQISKNLYGGKQKKQTILLCRRRNQIVDKIELSEIENLDEIEELKFSVPIKRELKRFLEELVAISTGKIAEPKQAIDELLIYRIHEKVRVLANYYKKIIDEKAHKDTSFLKELTNWFAEQNWSFTWSSRDFDKAARQTAYLLVNKILFYDLLQAKRPNELAPLDIPKGLLKGAQMQKRLQNYFDEVLEIDYQTIYTADFIDVTAFPDSKEVIKEIFELIDVLRKYDLTKLGYDVIGRIFERIIPQQERHYLGQYFTNADVVDLILKFCLKHEDDKVLDPACGAGTFLVRAYHHKKIMNLRIQHEKLLETLWGNDIAKFPAHFSTINLAINDLRVDKNYPNILKEDFFSLHVGNKGFDLPATYRKRLAVTLGKEEREITYPRWFDVIVGNPPYTRQEEIEDIGVNKEKLIESALMVGDKQIANISKRAGIHAYFFVHGTKFLVNGGRFGFIISNSWLDVDYGKGLQEFFLNNYRIIAILESKVERWFEEADVNTCIVLLEKCEKRDERDNNPVRFVYLKKPLRDFIPPVKNIWDKQIDRLNRIDDLKKTILAHNEFYENEELSIYPKLQKDLWDEGYDEESKEYIGSKWGKYLRAPEIFFKILEKGKDKLVPLKEIADVRFGIKTGANEFFYLTEEEIKQKKIEKEFWMHRDENGELVPNYVIKSARESSTLTLNSTDLKFRLLMVHKNKSQLEGKNVLKYIREGERKGFNNRSTCAVRERWYDLGERKPAKYNINYLINDVGRCFTGDIYVSDNFQELHSNYNLSLVLNSSYFWLFQNIAGRTNFGEGLLKIQTYEFENMLVVSPNLIKKLPKKLAAEFLGRKLENVFKEIGATEAKNVKLDKVKPDLRELDKIIMGDILGLTENEQLEVYKAVIDLVKSRLDKAKSVDNKNKIKGGIDINALKKLILDKAKTK